jgi:hypothetical protein
MSHCRFGTLLSVLLLILSASSPSAAQLGPPPAPSATVTVDCDAGDSLAAALATRADVLTVRFTGTCAEDLLIERDRLILRGLDASAVIAGADSVPPRSAVLLRGADVRLESFTVEGDDFNGIEVRQSSGVVIEGVTSRGNAFDGLLVEEGSSVRLTGFFAQNNNFGIEVAGNSTLGTAGPIVVSGNDLLGLFTRTDALVEPLATTVWRADDNGFAGALALSGSRIVLTVFQAAGNNVAGLFVRNASATVVLGEISGSTSGIFVGDSGELQYEGSVEGSPAIQGEDRSELSIDGLVTGDVLLDATDVEVGTFEGLTLNGSMYLTFGTRADFTIPAVITGDLVCDDTVLVRGAVCTASAAQVRAGAPAALQWPPASSW